jgi:branched-chain amino acid transport system ATP-binding protein
LPPDSTHAPPILEVANLRIIYGRAVAVSGLDLAVGEGEVVAMLGANGAGKSSTLLAISGLVPSEGQITFAGESISGVPPHAIARRRLVQVPEERAIFPAMTVHENLEVATHHRDGDVRLAADWELVGDALPRLHQLRDRKAGSLSGGEQQMLVLGKALVTGPRLLMIDELSLGLAPLVVQELFDVLARVNEAGVSILLVEQFVSFALALADRAYVLQKGEVIAAGTTDELHDDIEALAAGYLGAAS